MKKRGLLHKMNLKVLIILVLCIQIFGSFQISEIPVVKAEETGTEPKVTVSLPESGDYLKSGSITISGTVENYTSGMTVSLFNGAEQIGTPYEVNGNNWSIPVVLPEGTQTIDVMLVHGESTVASTAINNLTVDITPPIIEFVNLVEDAFSKSRLIELTTEPNATVQICMKDCTDDTSGTWVTVPKDSNGKWIYSDPQMTEGNQTVYAKATDYVGNVGPTNLITFTLDTLRPTILLDSIVPKYTEDMTQISINTEIKFSVSDANALNEEEIQKSINVTSNGEVVPGEVQYDSDTKEFSFIPLEGPFKRSTKYNVFISPLGVIDSAGNSAFPRFWSFTTESTPPTLDEENGQQLYEIAYNGKAIHRESPHEVYANNVNVCVNCHNTHEASDPNLLDQKVNSGDDNANHPVDNYCMACHDGTVAPLPENSQATHKHTAAIDIDGKPSGSSCASCHNPHLDVSEDNPNLVQDHIVYTHASDIKKENIPVGKISSKDQLCESCHESDSGEKIAHSDVQYRVFRYKKNISAIGIYEDYELCLRCHNPDLKQKYEKIADIASHYDNLTEVTKKAYETRNPGLSYSNREISAEEKEFSRHIIKAQDGSPLTGHIPCAECHDTHGSNNVKQLKKSLGHEGIQSFAAIDTDTVEVPSGENVNKFKILNDAKERIFCMSCHNGITAIYGVTGKKYDRTRIQHNDNPDKACSYCHGRGKTEVERALSAAHAPKEGIIPEP
jgi:hypothetical protein